MAERVAENLNRALHELFAADPRLYLLGEDVLDPYGGAFKISRGLSTRYPDRVLATPLSENGIAGVANGLALCGNQVIVEVMFGDFLLLALDQLVNFAAKSVTMFGQPVLLPVLVRCPVGGNRGYGATHSQSVQKFAVGVPDLELWELSPFVDAGRVLSRVCARRRPAVLFEDKVLYTKRMAEPGTAGDGWVYQNTAADPVWTVVRPHQAGDLDAVIVGAGGVAHRCLAAAAQLSGQHGVRVAVAVPTRLHPCDPAPVLDELARAGRVVIVEEGTPDGSWSGVLAHRLHTELWSRLSAPVMLLSSRDTIIPAAPHLERQVLVSTDDIVRGVLAVCRPAGPAVASARPQDSPAAGPAVPGAPLAVPRLNSNDDSAILLEWLVTDGDTVAVGQPVAILETSKCTAEAEAPAAGIITHRATAGSEYRFGHVIATVGDTLPAFPPPAPPPPGGGQPASRELPVSSPLARRRVHSVQAAVASAVTESHHTIPAAFAAVDVPAERALAHLDLLTGGDGALIGLGPLIITAIAALHGQHRALFAAVGPDGVPAATSAPDVAVTIDAGTGLFLPVIRAGAQSLDDIADRLTELQLAAVRGELTDRDLDRLGVGMAVSLNLSSGVDTVQPLIMPGMSCMVSTGAVRDAVRIGPDGAVVRNRTLTLGIAHDHRAVNGQPAMRFLTDLGGLLQQPEQIAPA